MQAQTQARVTGHSGKCTRGVRPTPVGRRVVACRAQAVPVDTSKVTKMRLKTLSDCDLGVSRYPDFAYNAAGGGGWAEATDKGNGVVHVKFDPESVIIPDLNWRTASIFKVPIPPPLNIAIKPQRLEGTLDTTTGEMQLEFDAEFFFTAASLYKAPALVVRTLLTTGSTKGMFREATGTKFDGFKGKLVGTATVPKTGDAFMDTFLMLPTDALAAMSAELEFQ